jgi:hypothetical protein
MTSSSLRMERAEQDSNLTPVASRNESEVEADLVPGTEVMTDMSGARVNHDSDNQDSIILIPQPTNDPHDPLVSINLVFVFHPYNPIPHPCF